jgi:hypothetical protein
MIGLQPVADVLSLLGRAPSLPLNSRFTSFLQAPRSDVVYNGRLWRWQEVSMPMWEGWIRKG